MNAENYLLVLAAVVHSVTAAYPGLLCPTEPNGRTFATCENDCIHQHNTRGGVCGSLEDKDYNCYCGPPNMDEVYEKGLQCRAQTEEYMNICTVDCQCDHGALGGTCDYERKTCNCFGYDPQNTMCPLKTLRQFAIYVVSQIESEIPPALLDKIQTAFKFN